MILVGTHRVQQEREARGIRVFRHGVQGPNVDNYGVVTNRIMTRQQLPPHPASRLLAGPYGQNVAPNPTIRNTLFIRQQLPDHPRSLLISAPPPVRAQIPFQRPLIVLQQRPWHPGPMLRAGTHPVSYEDIEFFVIP